MPYVSYGVNFTIEQQTQSNWCWAAVAKSTSAYFALPVSSPWAQCSLANAALNRTDCCPNEAPCNVPWYLDVALTLTNNLISMTGQISMGAVIAELQAGRPVPCRIAWTGGGAHFVVIYGYYRFQNFDHYLIADPANGYSDHPVVYFTNPQYLQGTWTNTYFTKAATP